MGPIRPRWVALLVALVASGCVGDVEVPSREPSGDAAFEWRPFDVSPSLGARYPGPEQNITEPSVAIDPTDPDRILVFAIDSSARNLPGAPYQTNRGFRSVDGGATWTDLGPMPVAGFDVPDSGDPVIVFDQEGTAYFVSLVDPPTESRYFYVFRSTDAGATWEPGVAAHSPTENRDLQMCESVDKEWIAAGPTRGHVALTYTRATYTCDLTLTPAGSLEPVGLTGINVQFRQSHDGGKTWSDQQKIWDGYALGATPVVSDDGTIHVAFYANVQTTDSRCPSAIAAALAAFGGGPFGAVVVATSRDQGATWTYTQHNICGREGTIAVSLPAFAVDRSRDMLYLLYATYDAAAERTTMVLRTSDDEGRTWSDALDVAPRGETQLPAIAALDGKATLMYGVDGPSGAEFWARRSMDDGATWTEPMRLNTEDADRAGSDYITIDMAQGRTVAVWADARDGPTEIRVRVGDGE